MSGASNIYPTAELRARDAAHHMHPFSDTGALNREGVRVITGAEGVWLTDSDGNRYLDGMAGLWCCQVGHGRDEIADAVNRQMRELDYYNTFFKTSHPPVIALSEKLAELSPPQFNRVFFTSSGSEANDTVFRMVRTYWDLMGKPEKKTIIGRWNGYHGSTLAGTSLGGMTAMHGQGDLPVPGVHHIAQPYWFGEGMLASPAMTPDVSFWAVHPASVLLLVIYLMGAYRTADMKENPMWKAVDTKETRHDTPDEETTAKESPARQIALFVAMMLVLGVAGWVIAQSAEQITDRMDLSAALVGALMTAVVTSLPELVTTLAAVRRGALQLAVGGIIGGNSFDVLFLTLSDFGYRDGSLYHAIGSGDLFWLIVGQAMTAILLLGLIVREKQGPGGIGWESVLMLSIYGGAVGFQAWSG